MTPGVENKLGEVLTRATGTPGHEAGKASSTALKSCDWKGNRPVR